MIGSWFVLNLWHEWTRYDGIVCRATKWWGTWVMLKWEESKKSCGWVGLLGGVNCNYACLWPEVGYNINAGWCNYVRKVVSGVLVCLLVGSPKCWCGGNSCSHQPHIIVTSMTVCQFPKVWILYLMPGIYCWVMLFPNVVSVINHSDMGRNTWSNFQKI